MGDDGDDAALSFLVQLDGTEFEGDDDEGELGETTPRFLDEELLFTNDGRPKKFPQASTSTTTLPSTASSGSGGPAPHGLVPVSSSSEEEGNFMKQAQENMVGKSSDDELDQNKELRALSEINKTNADVEIPPTNPIEVTELLPSTKIIPTPKVQKQPQHLIHPVGESKANSLCLGEDDGDEATGIALRVDPGSKRNRQQRFSNESDRITKRNRVPSPKAIPLKRERDHSSESDHHDEDIENCNINEPNTASNASPNSRKPRQIYSEEDRNLVLEADRIGGRRFRLEQAKQLGMPASTADNLISKFRKQDCNENDDEKRIAYGKLQHWHSHFLTSLLYFNGGMKLSDIRVQLNQETFRRIMTEYSGSTFKQPNDDSALQPTVQRMFETAEVRGDETIRRWIESIPISRRHVRKPRSVQNSRKAMADRFTYAEWLKGVIESPYRDIIMVDGMSFYLGIHKYNDWSSPGIKHQENGSSSPTCKRSPLKSQVGIATCPSIGLYFADFFTPERLVRLSPEGKRGGSPYSHTWSESSYLAFLNKVLGLVECDAPKFTGKIIYLVIDNIPVQREDEQIFRAISSLPRFQTANAALERSGARIVLVRAPEHATMLNLCEYFCRLLRTEICNLRNHGETKQAPARSYQNNGLLNVQLNILDRSIHNALCILKERSWEPVFQQYLHVINQVLLNQGAVPDHDP